MQKYTLYKSIVTISFLLTACLATFVYLSFSKLEFETSTGIYSAIWGIILLAFILFTLGWKLILDKHSFDAKLSDNKIQTNNETSEQEDAVNEAYHLDNIIEYITQDSAKSNKDNFYKNIISSLSKCLELDSALAFENQNGTFQLAADWAFVHNTKIEAFMAGEGLSGQVAKEGKSMMVNNLPESYFTILSGSGQAAPKSLYIIPIMSQDTCIAVLEFASLKLGDENLKDALDALNQTIVELREKTI